MISQEPFALEARNITMRFGGITAVSEVSLAVKDRSIFGIIGPNGAGKTTVFNMFTGVYTPSEGDITVRGKTILGLKPNQIASHGVSRTFQNIRIFKNISVLQNVLVALDHNPHEKRSSVASSLLRTKEFIAAEKHRIDRCIEILSLLGLEDSLYSLSRNLPYGHQRRLEIARALATGAHTILLDEPAAGMNDRETEELMRSIRHIRDTHHTTIILIEHDMKFVMEICEHIAVLDYGKKIAEGLPEEIQCNTAVLEAYLGRAKS